MPVRGRHPLQPLIGAGMPPAFALVWLLDRLAGPLPTWMRCTIAVGVGVVALLGVREWDRRDAERETEA